jgi:NTE family protein
MTVMLSAPLDIFRIRQYFNAITRVREVAGSVRSDAAFVRRMRRVVLPLPIDRPSCPVDPFPPDQSLDAGNLADRTVGLVSTGGSGALASLVGVARGLEEARVRPSVVAVCSGSALFGFPLAAGVPARDVARFTTGLRPGDYIDPDWAALLTLVPRIGRGFAGVLKGEAVEATYRSLLGDMTLGDMPVPCYAPIWNVEHNRVEYLGPRTHPDMTVARAVHMAIALPLFIDAVDMDDSSWCDGGIVDIFPVAPVLDIEDRPEVVVAVNGFYPRDFAGEDAPADWRQRPLSILEVASQVRTCQQIQLARENLRRLRDACEVALLEPVPYQAVRGTGFYQQFVSTDDWPTFMAAGRDHARRAIEALAATPPDAGRGAAMAV